MVAGAITGGVEDRTTAVTEKGKVQEEKKSRMRSESDEEDNEMNEEVEELINNFKNTGLLFVSLVY
jgi:hypothetical protein